MLVDPGEFPRSLIGRFLVENNPSGCNQLLNVARKVFERSWARRVGFGGRGTWFLPSASANASASVKRECERGRLRSSLRNSTRACLLREESLRAAFAHVSRPRAGCRKSSSHRAVPVSFCAFRFTKIATRLDTFGYSSSICTDPHKYCTFAADFLKQRACPFRSRGRIFSRFRFV